MCSNASAPCLRSVAAPDERLRCGDQRLSQAPNARRETVGAALTLLDRRRRLDDELLLSRVLRTARLRLRSKRQLCTDALAW